MSFASLAAIVLGTLLATLINDYLPIGGDLKDEAG